MGRAIDADALKEEIDYYIREAGWGETHNETLRWCLEFINNQHTIEPERKKGKWIEQDDCWDGVYYECSVCKEPFTLIDGTPSDNLYNFCPNCGADMTNS